MCDAKFSAADRPQFFLSSDEWLRDAIHTVQLFNNFISFHPIHSGRRSLCSAPLRPWSFLFDFPRRPKTTNVEFRVLRHTQMCCSGESAKQKLARMTFHFLALLKEKERKTLGTAWRVGNESQRSEGNAQPTDGTAQEHVSGRERKQNITRNPPGGGCKNTWTVSSGPRPRIRKNKRETWEEAIAIWKSLEHSLTHSGEIRKH